MLTTKLTYIDKIAELLIDAERGDKLAQARIEILENHLQRILGVFHSESIEEAALKFLTEINQG